jgi:hypothetical protein
MRAPITPCIALLAATGCWVDFDRFQPPRDAAAEPVDATLPDVPAPPDAFDAVVEPSAPDAPIRDATVDRVTCQPGRWSTTQVRVAHMAPEVGPIDICMQKRSGSATRSMARFQSTDWPVDGLDYGEVSRSVPLNQMVGGANEAWDIAVVARGTPCDRVPMDIVPLAARSIQLDPNTLRMIVITAEPALDGHLVPFINLLPDANCTDCTFPSADVRAVHAALGASSHRLTFAMVPQDGVTLPATIAAMRNFATGVSYGNDQGYACNQLWGALLTSRLRLTAPVRFEVSTAAGRLIARSDTLAIKLELLLLSRTVTVFFEGEFSDDGVPGPQAPGFVLCYDGFSPGLPASCERAAANLVGSDAGVDPPPVDAAWVDDGVNDAPPSVDGLDSSVP